MYRRLYHRSRRINADRNYVYRHPNRYVPYTVYKYNVRNSSNMDGAVITTSSFYSTVVSLLLIGFLAFVLTDSENNCKSNSYCSCNSGVTSKTYELICQLGKEISATIDVDQTKTEIVCDKQSANVNVSWIDLLIGLDLSETVYLEVKRCPIPTDNNNNNNNIINNNKSFDRILKSANMIQVDTFNFNSYIPGPNEFSSYHFANFNTVKRLHLEHNNLARLPPGLFGGGCCELLEQLFLSRNNISRLTSDIFPKRLTNLKRLDIGEVGLTDIEAGFFRNLPQLRMLILYENRLNSLKRNTFEHLPQLKSLDLSVNGITELPVDIFADLVSLTDLNLNKNNLTGLPPGVFRTNRALKNIQLNMNYRPLIFASGETFADLNELENLTLNRDRIVELPEDLISGLKRLSRLDLSHNRLKRLPRKFFKDANSLETLNVSYNELTVLEDDLFESLVNLRTLLLSYNRLKIIGQNQFIALASLANLDLRNNQLENVYIRNLERLKTIRLDDNFLKIDDEDSKLLTGCFKLEEIYLSRNRLSVIPENWKKSMIKLRTLQLDNNNFTKYEFRKEFPFVSTDITVNLSKNNISMVDVQYLEEVMLFHYNNDPVYSTHNSISPVRTVKMILDNNPLNCDCRSYQLARYFHGEMSKQVYDHFIFSPSLCSSPSRWENVSIEKIDLSLIECRWEDASEQSEPCPVECKCLFRPHDKAAIADCSDANLTNLPESLPYADFINHTELILTGNKISSLNSIVRLPVYKNVTKFELSYNKLTRINASHFSPKLQVLKLDNNQFTRLNYESLAVLNKSEYLEDLSLHGNPWKCDCDAQHFVYFLHNRFKQIKHLENITCGNTGQIITKLSVDDLCYISMYIIGSSVLVAVLGLAFGALAAFYYRYQQEIRVWLFTHKLCLWLVAEKELDRHKKYDAFVSYSNVDENFIVNHLVPGLENDEWHHRFKLCLAERDWIPGEWISNQIIKSVEDSRRTIVVLSPNFLKSVWGKMEFRTAHLKAMKEGCARVIIILYADVDMEKVDPELKAYLSTNTYLRWDDPRFWNKLRYALPHPPEYCKQLPIGKRKSTVKTKKKNIVKNSIAYSKSNVVIDSSSEHEEKIRQLNKLYSYHLQQI